MLVAGLFAVTLPLVGFVSLLLRSQLDPQLHNHQAHFVIFGLVGGVAVALGYAAGEAANRRGDARVLLLSLAFMATGLHGLHAFGTAGVLFTESRAGLDRDPGRAAGERALRRRLGVRRRATRARAAVDPPAREAGQEC